MGKEMEDPPGGGFSVGFPLKWRLEADNHQIYPLYLNISIHFLQYLLCMVCLLVFHLFLIGYFLTRSHSLRRDTSLSSKLV